MEYKPQQPTSPAIQPRIIIHGGAGNITPASVTPELYREFRNAILTIVSKTDTFMRTPLKSKPKSSSFEYNHHDASATATNALPTALETATYAVTLLENNPLFNAGHGAVFTRDGINELEASVMVSRGHIKRGVGVMGLRRVKNPIQLAKIMLEQGDVDLQPRSYNTSHSTDIVVSGDEGPDVPSAQGHCQLHGPTAEKLAEKYGLEMVDPGYFYTKKRWDEHIRALEREKRGQGMSTWSAEEYLPQGTCGAVALDKDGVLCVATSTGGLTNKLTGRIGDTPSLGAGFWAEEWVERGDPTSRTKTRAWDGPAVSLSESLKGLLAECWPTPFAYTSLPSGQDLVTTRSVAASGTGNGDSFLRTAAVRTVAAIAKYGVVSSAEALRRVTGPKGELQLSAGSRWGKTGEGEGGMIGIECVVVRNRAGNVVEVRSEILQDYNCGGMFRGWVDEEGEVRARVWRGDGDVPREYM